MKYVCLVYGEESQIHSLGAEELASLDARTLAYDRSVKTSGRLVIAQPLQSVRTARTVRKRGGKALVTDGPFAETKEQLLGFVMVEAGNIEEALEIAAESPLAETGAIEVRPIYRMPVT